MKKIIILFFTISVLTAFNVYSNGTVESSIVMVDNNFILDVYVQGDNIVFRNVGDGSVVEIYNTLGSKVQTSIIEGGVVNVSDLSKGIYIVKVGKYSKKVILQQ